MSRRSCHRYHGATSFGRAASPELIAHTRDLWPDAFGAFTAALVAERLRAEVVVFVAGMIPAPGETPDDWWNQVGFAAAVSEQAARDGGQTGSAGPFVAFYHDVPRALAEEEALRRERSIHRQSLGLLRGHGRLGPGVHPDPADPTHGKLART